MLGGSHLERNGQNKVDLAEALLAQRARSLVLGTELFLGLDDLQFAARTSLLFLPHQASLRDALVDIFLDHRHAPSHHLTFKITI